MSRNFLDDSAVLSGVDLHTYMTVVPPNPAPVPVPFHPTAVSSLFAPWASNGERCATVTADGSKMLKSSFELRAVPHVPALLPPPHPAEAANTAFIILTSSSAPSLYTSTVTGEGAALTACSVAASVAENIDCGQCVNVVVCISSVETEPTPSDVAAAWGRVRNAVLKDLAFAWLLSLLPIKGNPVAQEVMGWLIQTAAEYVMGIE